MFHQVNIKVLGGLNVTLEVETEYASFSKNWLAILNWKIIAVAGVEKNCDWLMRRIETKGEDVESKIQRELRDL